MKRLGINRKVLFLYLPLWKYPDVYILKERERTNLIYFVSSSTPMWAASMHIAQFPELLFFRTVDGKNRCFSFGIEEMQTGWGFLSSDSCSSFNICLCFLYSILVSLGSGVVPLGNNFPLVVLLHLFWSLLISFSSLSLVLMMKIKCNGNMF